MITASSHRFLRLHTHYKNGFLPEAGGICDQPNLYLEAMEFLEGTFNGINNERIKRDRESA